mgnify:CR=1 FL=1
MRGVRGRGSRFGKSGALVTNGKAGEFAGRPVFRRVHPANEALHLAAYCIEKRIQVFRLAFGDHFYAAVGHIADVATHRVVPRQVMDSVAEADALDVSAEVISPPLHDRSEC